ncbi:ferrous iron transporter B [Mergibacter septicus]|nr:ferrous iron transporter B [Mergibacter septicus]
MLNDLLVDGVIAGVGSVLVFLPQITLLFALILLLEDSGYLPRAAYLLDNFLAKTGLSGRAFIPLLSSFACAIPSVMSARTIHNPRERLVTIAIAPLLTCSARLPVYALIIAAVIPDQKIWGIFNLQGITLFALYLIGVLSAGMIAFLMKLFASKKGKIQQFPLLMELPTYRLPNLRHILIALWERVSAFLKRAGTIIFAISIILWALVTFPEAPINATSPAIDYSFAGMLGNLIQPIFAPIGFTWEMCIAMIPGLAAREVVVATLGTVYSVAATSEEMTEHALINLINTNWGLPTAFAFLAWYVYAPMCLATLAVIKRETNSNTKTVLIAGYLTGLAYLIALITYQIALRLVS